MRRLAALSLPVLIALALPGRAAAQSDPEALLRNMRPAWKKVNDLTTELKKRELFGTKLSAEESIYLKFQKPFKVYLKYLSEPFKGREGLYLGKDWNGGKIKATNGSFPNVTVNLDITGKMALDKQHHPISHVGFDFTIKNTLAGLDVGLKSGDVKLAISGTDTVDGRSCTKVEITYNAKAGQEVTPEKGDSWFSLATKYGSDYYVLQHNNPKKKPNDTSAKIWVPTYYGSKQEFCIDDATGLPIKASTWDHAGNLYEQYTYTKLKINVGLSDIDFDPKNSDYDF
jgi:outer membrane lipoprotein-sorting protein